MEEEGAEWGLRRGFYNPRVCCHLAARARQVPRDTRGYFGQFFFGQRCNLAAKQKWCLRHDPMEIYYFGILGDGELRMSARKFHRKLH